jgi:hypothetical protein
MIHAPGSQNESLSKFSLDKLIIGAPSINEAGRLVGKRWLSWLWLQISTVRGIHNREAFQIRIF